MKAILGRAGRGALRRFADSRPLIAFDFDGTLAPIVSRPDRAAMRAATRDLLQAVARRYPCAVISGRGRDDVRRRLGGVAPIEVIGNHGIESRQMSTRRDRRVRDWARRLTAGLAGVPCVRLEDKGYSLSVHLRGCREQPRVRDEVARLASSLDGVRVIDGKQVLNLVPLGAPTKGHALETARVSRGLDSAIYVGDDETDEDVFALGRPGRLLAIRVGRRRGSLAPYYLGTQAEIDRLLGLLVDLADRLWP